MDRCRSDVGTLFDNFKYEPGGSTTLANSVCFFIKEQIVAQGALMAFLDRGIRIPEDVKVVSLSDVGFGPAYVRPVTRFECDPVDAGEKISDFALAVLAKGRIPPPPVIMPQYIFGATFPF